jgi:hypothetical protein
MRYKSVNEELYAQYIRTHCVDAVYFEGDHDLRNDESGSSSPRTVTPKPEVKTSRTASPVMIRRAASASSRTPSSDDFEGMRKQSTVELNAETIRLYASSRKTDDKDVMCVYSPNDKEDDKSALFGAAHYT